MARYRVKKENGKFYIQKRVYFYWLTVSNEFNTSNDAIKTAQAFIESQKDNGKIVWESKK